MKINIKQDQKNDTKYELEKIIYCLKTPHIDGILQLIELNNDGLTQNEIFKILNRKGTHLEQDTLKILTTIGLIKKNYSNKEPTPTEKIIIKENVKTQEIKILKGEKGKRHAYIRTKNPIELLFEKLIQLSIEEKDDYSQNIFEELKKDISARWDIAIKEFDFNTDYINISIEEAKRVNELTIKTINEGLSKETDQQKIEIGLNLIKSLNKLKQQEEERYKNEIIKKQRYRQELIFSFRDAITKQPKQPFYFHSHTDYITLILQRIILEEYSSHFSKFYYYVNTKQNPNIDKRRIEIIKKLVEDLNPKTQNTQKELSLFEEMTERLINLENSVRLEITKQNIIKEKNPKVLKELEQEIDKTFFTEQQREQYNLT